MDWVVLLGNDDMPKNRGPSLDEAIDIRANTDEDSEGEVVLEDSEIGDVGLA